MSQPRYRPPGGYWLVFTLGGPRCWPRQAGPNVLSVELVLRDGGLRGPAGLRDVELESKYLMGAAFHRGQDADLGPVVQDAKARM
eukprot:SAG11_NODE_3616_length_2337_cov_1.323503_3_plen_85_part_00